MEKYELRIGITMRVTHAENYVEPRDTIAQDWPRYMEFLLPHATWIFVPNLGENVVSYIKKWDLNAFILTGGEDLGVSAERDRTEQLIFEYAKSNKLPVLGICRGFQAIYTWMGGKVEMQVKTFKQYHTATKHNVLYKGELKLVNSFHGNKAEELTLPKDLNVLAVCKHDKSIEAFEGENILGFMWHPEREKDFQLWDGELIRKLFKYEK